MTVRKEETQNHKMGRTDKQGEVDANTRLSLAVCKGWHFQGECRHVGGVYESVCVCVCVCTEMVCRLFLSLMKSTNHGAVALRA